MSVYTKLSLQDCQQLLSQYQLGNYVQHTPISDGVTNTVYHLQTSTDKFILVLYEVVSDEDVMVLLKLNQHLQRAGLPCAKVYANREGLLASECRHKKASIISVLPGVNVSVANEVQCEQVGVLLAGFHQHSQSFQGKRQNQRSWSWYLATAQQLTQNLAISDKVRVERELTFLATQDFRACIQGWIHADLFRDNVFFEGDKLVGLIDFDFCCQDYYLIDIAIAINDWCSNKDGSIDQARYQSLLNAYQQQRLLTAQEQQHLSAMLRYCALRFYLSRLQDYHRYQGMEGVQVKDPQWFAELLDWHQNNRLYKL